MNVKEIPILFSTPMVQAILEGRKTMTRRVIKSRHESGLFQVSRRVTDGRITSIESLDWDERNCEKDIICPYGKPGDILWVRESSATTYSSGLSRKVTRWYKADNPEIPDRVSFKWKPSIHMPKAAARVWLEVTDIRVERLQDISEDDAIAEGVVPIMGINLVVDDDSGEEIKGSGKLYKHYLKNTHACIWPSESFQTLWQSINGEESWNANPWIWVVSFKVLSTTGKPKL